MPLVVPQLRTITLGGAVTGLGIESTSFRNGLPHESVLEMDVLTGAGEVVTATARQRARRPVRGLPQLLRLASATPPGCGSSSSRSRPYVALRHVRFDDLGLLAEDDRRDHRHPQPGTASRSTASTASCSPRRGLPDPGPLGARPSPACRTSDYTGQQIYYRVAAAARDRRAHRLRLPVALGHRLVLVLRRVRRCSTRGCGGSGRGAGAAATSTTGWSASTHRFGVVRRLDAARGSARA